VRREVEPLARTCHVDTWPVPAGGGQRVGDARSGWQVVEARVQTAPATSTTRSGERDGSGRAVAALSGRLPDTPPDPSIAATVSISTVGVGPPTTSMIAVTAPIAATATRAIGAQGRPWGGGGSHSPDRPREWDRRRSRERANALPSGPCDLRRREIRRGGRWEIGGMVGGEGASAAEGALPWAADVGPRVPLAA
jgi:hypothetical protein